VIRDTILQWFGGDRDVFEQPNRVSTLASAAPEVSNIFGGPTTPFEPVR